MFVHTGLFQLLVNCAALVQLGLILERLVGHITFAAVYLAAGVLASLVSLSDYPMAISAGASGAIFGLYGLLAGLVGVDGDPPRASQAVEPQPVASAPSGSSRRSEETEPVEPADVD